MTSLATVCGMDLSRPNEWCGAGAVAADAINRDWRDGDIGRHRGGVIMAVAVEVGTMALGTRTAIAVVDRGIAIAVNPNHEIAVDWVVA